MKIYKISFDVNNYQALYPEEEPDLLKLCFNGVAMGSSWKSPMMYSPDPLLKRPDFWYIAPGAIAAGALAFEKVQTMFEMAGELLELPYRTESLTVLNVTECVNALNHDASEWLLTAEGKRVFPTRYVFHKNRLGESSIFKIPETRAAEIYCAEWEGDPETEFKAAVEHHQLKGLIFKEMWSSD